MKYNKYYLNYIQWLTGLPRNITKTVTNLRYKDNNIITYTCKIKFNPKDWRMGTGHCE